MDTILRLQLMKFGFLEEHIQVTYEPPISSDKLDTTNFTLGPGHQCPGYALAATGIRAASEYNKAHTWQVQVHNMGSSEYSMAAAILCGNESVNAGK